MRYMSFSAKVKEELAKLDSTARHCQIAELAAIVVYGGAELGGHAQERYEILLHKLFQEGDAGRDPGQKLMQCIKYKEGDTLVDPLVVKSMCCKRAFLRGAFLAIGSMSNPEKGYHLEFVCSCMKQADQLVDMLAVYEIRARVVARKKYQVVYIKESEEISTLLNVIGAHVSLMELENLRILKDMRNSVNRKVNCEAANITKTVNAAAKQIEDIQYLKDHYGFDNLPDNLSQIAGLRLEHPEATLKELGEYLSPVVGKSGVNHRLRKLSDLAGRLREKH